MPTPSSGGHEARAQRHLLLPALQAVQSTRRLDQRGRAQLRLRTAIGAPRRRVRRRHLLRVALHRSPAQAGAPRLRRHRVPLQGRPQSCARSWSGRRATRRTTVPTATTSRSARTTRSGSEARASASATRRRRPWSPSRASSRSSGSSARWTRRRPSGSSAGDLGPSETPHPTLPQAGDASLQLLRRVNVADPTSLDAYRSFGGYEALRARDPRWGRRA